MDPRPPPLRNKFRMELFLSSKWKDLSDFCLLIRKALPN